MVPKSIKEAFNRGNNLLIVGFMAVLAVGVMAEIFNEPEFTDKIDDILILLLGVGAIIWYFRGDNRFRYSWTPFILLAASLAVKVGALFFELDDQAAVGDEFGIVPTLLALTIISLVIMLRSRQTLKDLDQRQVNC
jgi:peptidoglycan/LPS O-acetylase OafA/YrhL